MGHKNIKQQSMTKHVYFVLLGCLNHHADKLTIYQTSTRIKRGEKKVVPIRAMAFVPFANDDVGPPGLRWRAWRCGGPRYLARGWVLVSWFS
jgi:hypothetical protein